MLLIVGRIEKSPQIRILLDKINSDMRYLFQPLKKILFFSIYIFPDPSAQNICVGVIERNVEFRLIRIVMVKKAFGNPGRRNDLIDRCLDEYKRQPPK